MGEYVDKLLASRGSSVALSAVERVESYTRRVNGHEVHVSAHTRRGSGKGTYVQPLRTTVFAEREAQTGRTHRASPRVPSSAFDPKKMPAGWSAKERDKLGKKISVSRSAKGKAPVDEFLAALEEFYDRFPEQTRTLDKIDITHEMPEGANGAYSRLGKPTSAERESAKLWPRSEISVRPDVDEEAHQAAVGRFFSAYGEDHTFMQASLTHELGHHLFERLPVEEKDKLYAELADVLGDSQLFSMLSGAKPPDVLNAWVVAKNKSKLTAQLSEYSTYNEHEVWAEVWAEWATNPNPRPLAARMGAALERAAGRTGGNPGRVQPSNTGQPGTNSRGDSGVGRGSEAGESPFARLKRKLGA